VVPLVAPVESNGPHRHLRVTPSNPLDDTAASARIEMRRTLRERRAALTARQRSAAAQRIASHVAHTRWLHGARSVGLYAAVGNEVDTRALAELARQRHCPIYLPRISDYHQHRMQFVLQSGAASVRNRHGIPEPATHKRISARALSIVFMPIVGFDARGTRLGSGAGYYDRLFWFRRYRSEWQRPLLVGIAFRCQELAHIDPQPHDVPLDALVSEDGVRYFSDEG
jgi:5-formyltetrahydrofolate cyclo-ligase